jgi:hypothetical protein
MRIARVFPTKTSMSPVDKDAYFDGPGIFTPQYDEVHISTVFSWDIPRANELAKQWSGKGLVKIGGPAISGEPITPFQSGMYLRPGITITSRGCPNRCCFCLIKQDLIEFDDFPEGNIIQDNNILACSARHWRLVIDMLKNQREIEFKGGLEARRLTPQKVEDLKILRIKSLWFACDTPEAIPEIRKVGKLLKDFKRKKLYCYVLIGKDQREEKERLNKVYEAGFYPFAQLYKAVEPIAYSHDWKMFQRQWSRPAAIYAMKKGEVKP